MLEEIDAKLGVVIKKRQAEFRSLSIKNKIIVFLGIFIICFSFNIGYKILGHINNDILIWGGNLLKLGFAVGLLTAVGFFIVLYLDKKLKSKRMNTPVDSDIEMLDKIINTITGGNQSEFARITHIKESTIKTWRDRKKVPDNKKLLLNTLLENHELKEKLADYEQYFTLQGKLSKKFQN